MNKSLSEMPCNSLRDSLTHPENGHWLERQDLVNSNAMAQCYGSSSKLVLPNPTSLSWLMIAFVTVWDSVFPMQGLEVLLLRVFEYVALTRLTSDVCLWRAASLARRMSATITTLRLHHPAGSSVPSQQIRRELAELLKWLLDKSRGSDFEATESAVFDFCRELSIIGLNLTDDVNQRSGRLLFRASLVYYLCPCKRTVLIRS
jgi:hypothetical protein